MKKPNLASLGLIGLAYGGILVMGAADGPARDHAVGAAAKAAAKQADQANRALNRRDGAAAVSWAEQAVALVPHDMGYRMILAQSYLQAGRFGSATQAFTDVLALDGTNGKAALNLALAQVGTGDWQGARATLAAHSEIPASDRGLAMALAGDTAGGVTMLTAAARSPEASAKVRQNLALAYALGGQWQAARVVAQADLSPADVDGRMTEWAAFAQPRAASDQVAALLGVRPAADGGQPVGLALNAPAMSPAVAVAAALPLAAIAVASVSAITFAAPHEVVQALPSSIIPSAAAPIKVRLASARATAQPTTAKPMMAKPTVSVLASGDWYVQLGAFDSARVARDAWDRATRRYAAFAGHQPKGMNIKAGPTTLFRLSVGGFGHPDADRACRTYRSLGGACFVRVGAGDKVAMWVSKERAQLAMK